MPTYQYECDSCGHTFEFMQSIVEKIKDMSFMQKDTLHRLIGRGAGIIFKGTGFYETDYKNKSCPDSKKVVQLQSLRVVAGVAEIVRINNRNKDS